MDFDLDDFLPPRQLEPASATASETIDFDPVEMIPQPIKSLAENVASVKPLTYTDSLPFPLIEDPMGVILRLLKRLLQAGPFSFNSLDDLPANFPANFPGIYAIFYQGTLPIYEPIRSLGSTCPIYNGKSALSVFVRLRKHRFTLQQTDLGLENFTFRFIHTPEPGLAEFAESFLNSLYHPLWNDTLKGFSNNPNDEVHNRKYLSVSLFDTFHPGRPVDRPNLRSLDEITQLLEKAVPQCRRDYEWVQAILTKPHDARYLTKDQMTSHCHHETQEPLDL